MDRSPGNHGECGALDEFAFIVTPVFDSLIGECAGDQTGFRSYLIAQIPGIEIPTQSFIWLRVTLSGSSTRLARIRASWSPEAQSSPANPWFLTVDIPTYPDIGHGNPDAPLRHQCQIWPFLHDWRVPCMRVIQQLPARLFLIFALRHRA